MTAAEIRYLDVRTRNPADALLGYCENSVGYLYDTLVACDLPVLADIL